MHPQNNNHDIISEHELKKNLSVQKVTKTRCFNEMYHRGKNFCQFFFIVLKLKNMNPYVFVFGELKYVLALVFIFFTRCKKCISS